MFPNQGTKRFQVVLRDWLHSGALLLILPVLILAAKDYRGAEYRTHEPVMYGRIEAAIMPGRAGGQLASLFTYHEIETTADWSEIDIEIMGRYTDDIQLNVISSGQANHVHHEKISFDPYADFHVYGFEWTPDYVAWFIDGVQVSRQTGAHIGTIQRPQKIMMNTWPPVYEGWSGLLDARSLPIFHYYDWLSYAAFTPDSGSVGTDNNFTPLWRDEFTGWDTQRWDKATHTFPGNNCDFIPENVVFSDGRLILCLTDPNNTGYVDRQPPAVLSAVAIGNTIWVNFSEDLNPTDAEQIGSYQLRGGGEILAARLLPDRRTVELSVTEIASASSTELVVAEIRDRFSNTLFGQVAHVKVYPEPDFPLKINVGGPDTLGFIAGQAWSDTANHGYLDRWGDEVSDALISGPEGAVYGSWSRNLVGYNVRLPAGSYRVTVLLAEIGGAGPGERIFEMHVGDQLLAGYLDLATQAGPNTPFPFTADDVRPDGGIISVHFGSIAGEPVLNGLVFEQLVAGLGHRPALPERRLLGQNYPNPFNNTTRINLHLPESSFVTVDIFDVYGRMVDSLLGGRYLAGDYTLTWGADLPSGVYLYRLHSRGTRHRISETRKMVLLK